MKKHSSPEIRKNYGSLTNLARNNQVAYSSLNRNVR